MACRRYALAVPFSFDGGTTTGTFVSSTISDSNNTFCSGYRSDKPIGEVIMANFTGYPTDVGYESLIPERLPFPAAGQPAQAEALRLWRFRHAPPSRIPGNLSVMIGTKIDQT